MPATMKISSRITGNAAVTSSYTLSGVVSPMTTAWIASRPPGCNG